MDTMLASSSREIHRPDQVSGDVQVPRSSAELIIRTEVRERIAHTVVKTLAPGFPLRGLQPVRHTHECPSWWYL